MTECAQQEWTPILGGRSFTNIVEANRFFTEMVHVRYEVGQDLGAEDFAIALDLLRHHPEAERKLGTSPITDIGIRPHPTFHNACLTLFRSDGSSEDFSANKCVDSLFRRTPRKIEQKGRVQVDGLLVRFDLPLTSLLGGGAIQRAGVQQKTAMRDLCGRIRAILEEATAHESRILCLDISPKRTFHFAKLPDPGAATALAAKLASQQPIKVEVLPGTFGELDGFAVATGDEEKIFWSRGTRLPAAAAAAAAAAPTKVTEGGEQKQQQQPAETKASKTEKDDGAFFGSISVAAAAGPAKGADQKQPTEMAPMEPVIPRRRIPKGAPRVTPTEGQTKRQPTAVGRAGNPPAVVPSKKQKVDPIVQFK